VVKNIKTQCAISKKSYAPQRFYQQNKADSKQCRKTKKNKNYKNIEK
jgi:hypothetical protein